MFSYGAAAVPTPAMTAPSAVRTKPTYSEEKTRAKKMRRAIGVEGPRSERSPPKGLVEKYR